MRRERAEDVKPDRMVFPQGPVDSSSGIALKEVDARVLLAGATPSTSSTSTGTKRGPTRVKMGLKHQLAGNFWDLGT